MAFDIFMSLGSFIMGSTFAGLIFLLSAFLISPFCEKLFRKFPALPLQNSVLARVSIQILCSIVLFVIGVTQLPTNTSETIETGILTTETEQVTSEEPTTENIIEETSTSAIVATTETEATTTEITTITTTTTTIIETTTNLSEYDALQIAFMTLSFDSHMADIEKIIEESNLEFTKENYNEKLTYALAYDENVARQKRGFSGDCLEIIFSREDGSLMYAEYTKRTSNKLMNALLYNYGTYWDFRFETPQNQYSGYYYYRSGDMSEHGIVFQYDNGNSHETSYHPCNDAEEALKNVLTSTEE